MTDTYKPLVILSSGSVGELPLDGSLGAIENQPLENNESATNIVAGNLCYSSGNGLVKKAIASSAATSMVSAMCVASTISPNNSGAFALPGQKVELANWTAITGATSLLPNTLYFLSGSSAGTMVTTPPTSAGYTVTRVGYAISTTVFVFLPETPIVRAS